MNRIKGAKRYFARSWLVAIALLASCKDSAGPVPQSAVTFAPLPPEVVATYCVQGNRTVADAVRGTLASTDCPFGDGSFFESWRIRVAEDGEYRLAASGSFDNLLILARIDSVTGTTASLSLVASDDDSGPELNALIERVLLDSDTDYLLVVNGYDAGDVGPYSVAFTRR